jgi:ribonuclease BN (tRNA processing enzyme)
MIRRRIALMPLCLFFSFWQVAASPQERLASKTQVVMLGTGTPLPDPDRAGPSTALIVNGTAYLVDAGTGVVRHAAAARDRGIKALEPKNLKIAFLTHLHSDHTLGLADLILTPWTMGRTEPLELYGPPGTRSMVQHLLEAYAVDIKTRIEGLERSSPSGYHVNVHEIAAGLAYKDANVTVTAFDAHHGSIPAYGYRFEAPDRTVVIAGDGSGKNEAPDNCRGCDVLIAEAYTLASLEMVPPQWKQYRQAFHASSKELADVANRTKPATLVLYHIGNAGCDQVGTQACRDAGSETQLLAEIRKIYKGRVVAAHDLDVY